MIQSLNPKKKQFLHSSKSAKPYTYMMLIAVN